MPQPWPRHTWAHAIIAAPTALLAAAVALLGAIAPTPQAAAATPVPTLWGIDDDDGQVWRIDDYRRPDTSFIDYGPLYFANPYRGGEPEPLVPFEDIGRDGPKHGAKCFTLDRNDIGWFVIARPLATSDTLAEADTDTDIVTATPPGERRGPHLAWLNVHEALPRLDAHQPPVTATVVGAFGLDLPEGAYVSGLVTHPIVSRYLIATLRVPGEGARLLLIDKATGSAVTTPSTLHGRMAAVEDIDVDPTGRILLTDTDVDQLVGIEPGDRPRRARQRVVDVDQSAGLESMAGLGDVALHRRDVSIKALAVPPRGSGAGGGGNGVGNGGGNGGGDGAAEAVGFDTYSGRLVILTLRDGGNRYLPIVDALRRVEGMAFQWTPPRDEDRDREPSRGVEPASVAYLGGSEGGHRRPPVNPQVARVFNRSGFASSGSGAGYDDPPIEGLILSDGLILDPETGKPKPYRPPTSGPKPPKNPPELTPQPEPTPLPPGPTPPPGGPPPQPSTPTLVPAPSAALAGLAMLGTLLQRRRRR